jgi:hypothetical protein
VKDNARRQKTRWLPAGGEKYEGCDRFKLEKGNDISTIEIIIIHNSNKFSLHT